MINWQTKTTPEYDGFYITTVRRHNGSRFFGYAYYDRIDGWLTANKKFCLDLDIIAWANPPKPYDGPIFETQKNLFYGR
ncbi:MAG: hypothetical protein ACR2K1_14160 [Saprospiraceae bacterium]